MTGTFEQLAALLAEKFGVDPQEITPEITFADLELDSLAAVEVAAVLQELLGVPVNEDEFTPDSTLREIAETLDRHNARAQ